ncbi:YjgB family protein [Paenibacillus sp. FSL M7-0802]|uniref:YjgB family protein n=1 Tax=Paenibacillus TaxID=44249 RepID=UPI0022227EEE|nr:YjgB family protein [Paenibacillus polymyxa]
MKHIHQSHDRKKLACKLITTSAFLAIGFAVMTGCSNSGEAKSTAPTKAETVKSPASSTDQNTDLNTNGQGSTSTHQEPASSTASSHSKHSSAAALFSAAKQGTLPNLPKGLGLGTSSDLLFELWGKSESGSTGPMRSYAKYHTDIVLDGSDKVTEITSSDPDYKKLLIKQVVDELGQPTETVDTSRDIPDTAEANYTINNTSGLSYYLVFSYQTKTQKVNYIRLYFNSKTP